MLENNLKNILLKGLTIFVICSILGVCLAIKVYADSTNIQEEVKYEKQKILLYSSHNGSELYSNNKFGVEGACKDLKKKLEKMGYVVDHLEDDFSIINGYNNSYLSSRNKLLKLNLKKYSLIIDVHRDWGISEDVVIGEDNKDFAKIMIVYDKSTKNYPVNKSIGDIIKNNLKNYLDIAKENYIYNSTSSKFNQDLSNNTLLIEVGNLNNNEWQIKRSITYLSKAIRDYLTLIE